MTDPKEYKFELDYGYVIFRGNEIHIFSTIDDPPQVYIASNSGISLGGMTFGRAREDGRTIDGMVLIQGKQDERTRDNPKSLAGELTIHVRDGDLSKSDDAQFVKVLEIRHDSVWIKGISDRLDDTIRFSANNRIRLR